MCAEYVFCGLLGVFMMGVEILNEYSNKKEYEKYLTEPETCGIMMVQKERS